MTIDQNNYFDFYNIFVNEIIGDLGLAIIVGMVIVAYLCVTNNVSFKTTLALEILFVVIIVSNAYNIVAWVFVVLIIGVIFYYVQAKLIGGN